MIKILIIWGYLYTFNIKESMLVFSLSLNFIWKENNFNFKLDHLYNNDLNEFININ